jgi:hypothetical protein
MKLGTRRSVPSWRVTDARTFRLQPALAAFAVLGVLLMEVWQCSTVASLSDQLGRATHSLQQANAELEWTRARLDRESSRAALGPVAGAMGLKPADPQAIVSLPEEYLEPAEGPRAAVAPRSLLALAGGALHAIVPDASARGRHLN